MNHPIRRTMLVTLAISALLLAVAGLRHLFQVQKSANLDTVLLNAGCEGDSKLSQGGKCHWVEFSFNFWWLPALVVLVFGLVVAVSIWWVRNPRGSDLTEDALSASPDA